MGVGFEISYDQALYAQYLSLLQVQAKNLEAEMDAEAKEECCLLAHSLWFAHLSFL